MRFSERMKQVVLSDVMQREDMNKELRNSLWNMFCFCLERDDYNQVAYELQKWLYFHLYKLPVDEIRQTCSGSFLKREILESEWFKVYDLLEEVVHFLGSEQSGYIVDKDDFIKYCNLILKRENSAYRFIDDEIVEITNEEEMKSIENAINTSNEMISMHMKNALVLLSNREHPDYRNSIKESISSVEAICRQITNESTLDKALPKLKTKGIIIPDKLYKGMKELYYFTNGEAGIRHALMDESINIDFEEAKYMLVVCSAFVNYLKEKLAKNGVGGE